MYSLHMLFYKDGVNYKEATVDNLKFAKDVDDKISKLIKTEYCVVVNRSSVKYIYDTINNPKKIEYIDELNKIEYDNTKFVYDIAKNKYYTDHAYSKVNNKLNYIVIVVSKN